MGFDKARLRILDDRELVGTLVRALEAALAADLLASDPPAQLEAYGDHFLPPEARRRVVPLSAPVAKQRPGRRRADERTVFLSAGLAGNEPVVARRLFGAFGGGGYGSGS